MRHLWQWLVMDVFGVNKVRCQYCEDILTFNSSEGAKAYIEADTSEYCQGIPGPKAYIAHGFDKYPVRAPVVAPMSDEYDNDYY